MMMILRPQGLLPERRHKMELAERRRDHRRQPLHGTGMSATTAPAPARRLAKGAADARRGQHHQAVRRPDRRQRRLLHAPGAARSSRSSAPTAPARRRSSTCSPASTGRRSGTIGFDGREHHRRPAGHHHEGRDGADVPEHPPVLDHDRDGERDDRRALAHARRACSARSSARRGCAARSARCARRRTRCSSTSGIDERAGTTSSRSTSPTATSAGWRSPARWPPTRSCCCSTSRRPA